jgi:hypothetical protein
MERIDIYLANGTWTVSAPGFGTVYGINTPFEALSMAADIALITGFTIELPG